MDPDYKIDRDRNERNAVKSECVDNFCGKSSEAETLRSICYLIICRSLTYAQRTAQVLERVGIPGWVQRSPKLISKEGCGYCVRIPERRLTDALTVLRREGMSPKQVFLQTAEGEYSEVRS